MSSQIATIKEYYRRSDNFSPDLLDLFTDDFTFYYPKFGFGRGRKDFEQFAVGLLSSAKILVHPIEAMRFVEQGTSIVVEGIVEGELHSGAVWKAGTSAAGRFCSLFDFRNGLISRMHIYVDPDYGSMNSAGFLWGRDRDW
jgi:ketosteroid isomerase-like protein